MFFDKRKKVQKLCEKAEVLYYQQQPEAAEQAVLRARELAATLPDVSLDTQLHMQSLLAGIYRFTERYDLALQETLSSLPLLEQRGQEDEHFAGILNNAGEILLDLGRPQDALPYLERAVALKERLYADAPQTAPSGGLQGDPAMELAVTYRDLGRTHAAVGNIADAVQWYEKALDKIGQGGDLGQLTEISSETARYLTELGQQDRAVDLLRHAEDIITRSLKTPMVPSAVRNPHHMFFELMKKDFAENGRVPSEFLRLRIQRFTLQHQMGRGIDAEELPELTDAYARINGEHSPEVADEYQALAVDLHLLGQASGQRAYLEQARDHYEYALPILSEAMGEDHPEVQRIEESIEEVREDLAKLP
jgi:tetratricopeptide (TPR) repeat protein